jgi:hypothetical protein
LSQLGLKGRLSERAQVLPPVENAPLDGLGRMAHELHRQFARPRAGTAGVFAAHA